MTTTTTNTTANGRAVLSPLDVLTLAEAAAYLQVSEGVLRAEAEAGRVAGRSIGGDWRFLRGAIIDWLREGPAASPPPRPPAGVGKNYDEDPEEVIAVVYRERLQTPVRG